MPQLHTKTLHTQAKDLLRQQGDSPRKLVLFHTLLALGIPLLVALINFLLEGQNAKTGGLDGIAARSTLQTIQSTLESGVMILLPFWEVGLLYAALSWRKGQAAGKAHLTEGLRRFVNVFALRFWSGVLYVIIGFTALNLSMFIFSATPWVESVADLLNPGGQATTPEQLQQMMTPALMNQLMVKMIPLFVILVIIYAAVCIPLSYRLRFADYILLEGEGGRQAMLQSFRLTRGRCKEIFKLDLHFWWFYVLQLLAVGLCYGDSILALLGVTLPLSSTLSYFLFYTAGLILQGVLFWRYQAERLTAYCLAYDDLQPQPAPDIPLDI